MSERESSFFLFENELRPMSIERFADIELAIRSLRDIPYECIVVSFKDVYNHLSFIQAVATVDYKEYHIEIGFDIPGKKNPDIYVNENVSVIETIDIFKQICTKTDMPSLEGWLLYNFRIFDKDGKLLHPADDVTDNDNEISK